MVQQQAPSAVSPMGAQQPSMMQQMMATAGGVAIGSAVVSIFFYCFISDSKLRILHIKYSRLSFKWEFMPR
jgi:hypothetical protein